MAIYDLLEHVEKCIGQDNSNTAHIHNHRYTDMTLRNEDSEENFEKKSHIFSSIAARLFFFMLLIVDLVWGIYSILMFSVSLVLNLLTGFRISALKRFHAKRYLNLKRPFICAVSLLVSLFSPALGTMFACTYFMMYDKKGIEEVVPSVLQDQFREFFNHS